jgi:hypothetical protein
MSLRAGDRVGSGAAGLSSRPGCEPAGDSSRESRAPAPKSLAIHCFPFVIAFFITYFPRRPDSVLTRAHGGAASEASYPVVRCGRLPDAPDQPGKREEQRTFPSALDGGTPRQRKMRPGEGEAIPTSSRPGSRGAGRSPFVRVPSARDPDGTCERWGQGRPPRDGP